MAQPLLHTASYWSSNNPVLLPSQVGIESDTGIVKYGDGVTAWNALSYVDPNVEYSTTSGTDTYVASLKLNGVKGYFEGMRIRVKFGNGNTGASTINVNGFGAKSIKKQVSTALASGDIIAGAVHTLTYDGTNFQIENGISSSAAIPTLAQVLASGNTTGANDISVNNGRQITSVSGNSSKYISFSGSELYVNAEDTVTNLQGLITLSSFDASAQFYSADGVNASSLTNYVDYGLISSDKATYQGYKYAADYSANYTTRSLIDKGYLTSVLASYPTGSGAANHVAYWSGASTLTSSANLQFDGTKLSTGGTDAMTVNGSAITTRFASHASDGLTEVNAEFHKYGATAAAGAITYFARARGVAGAPTIVSNGDTLGYIGIAGYDGTDYALGGYLKWTTDAAVGANDMPTALAIGLSPDGTQTPVDVLTISSAGVFTMTGSLSVSTTINATTGYKVNSAAASGTFLRGDGTNYVSSTLTIPNTATVNRVVYATGANAWGDSANLTFDGNSLTVGTSVISSIMQGSTAASGSLTLRATSNATDGAIIFQSDSTTETARILSTGQFVHGGTALISAEVFSIQKNQNTGTYQLISNTTSNTVAFVGTKYSANSATLWTGALSTLYTTSGLYVAQTAFISSDTGAGINIGTTNSAQVSIWTNNTKRFAIPSAGGVVVGIAALATTATDGFLYIPTCAGTPTGVPTAQTGTVPMIYDTTNNKLYIYNGGWKGGTTPGTFV